MHCGHKGSGTALQLTAVVGPLKKCLPLAWSAPPIARLAMMTDLCNVAAHSFPPPDLANILFRQSAAEIISAIPLKPPARIVRVNPALLPPNGKRLTCVYAEIVERKVTAPRR